MNKKKEKSTSNLSINFQVESRNLQYTITLRENEIKDLKLELQNKKAYIINLEGEIKNLRNACINSYKLDKELKEYRIKTDNLQKELNKLNNDLITQQKKYEEEKRATEKLHKAQILQLKLANESYAQKIEMANQIIIEKANLIQEVENLKKEKEDIIFHNKETLRQKEINNEIKFTNLKKKMMDNINETQSKVTQLNIQYMDVSTKLTLLQNHQLLIQLEYQIQQIDELTEKKESLEKKVYELNNEIAIHKEVELSLAEKNKKLQLEVKKNKKEENNNESKTVENNSAINNNYSSNISLGFDENNSVNTNYNKLKALEKKVLNLEKQLSQKIKDYNYLKDNYEYIQNKIKNYKSKYSGLFHFFEDCLQSFFDDEEIKNNKEIFINIEALKKGDFNAFNKNEKYSILIILMKYLLPLINGNEIKGNINLRSKVNYNSNLINQINNQKRVLNSSRSSINIGRKKSINSQNSIDSLPSIRPFKYFNNISSNLNPSKMKYENENK